MKFSPKGYIYMLKLNKIQRSVKCRNNNNLGRLRKRSRLLFYHYVHVCIVSANKSSKIDKMLGYDSIIQIQ